MRLMVFVVKLSICLSLILTSQLNKKGLKIFTAPLILMLRIANLSENLLTSVDVTKTNEVLAKNITAKAIQILSKSQKPSKIIKV